MKKICVITSGRADFGLLKLTIKEIERSSKLDLQLVVTGSHLDSTFGNTVTEVEAAGFPIAKRLNIIAAGDTSLSVANTMATAISLMAETFTSLDSDLVLILGDRYEIFSAAIAALSLRLPIGHIHGGELTEGVMDDAIRHAITKMSHLHFVATSEYRDRVIQMGEGASRVHIVGALGVESIHKVETITKEQLEKNIGFKFHQKNLLITFHPPTLEPGQASGQLKELLSALETLDGYGFIFTYPNFDPEHAQLIELIKIFVAANPLNSIAVESLGQVNYFSCIKYVDAVVGNSSSGLLEVPIFKKPTINIGNRQRGRLCAPSVINCKPIKNEILISLAKTESSEYLSALSGQDSPYENHFQSSKEIARILEETPFNNLLDKKFHDLEK